MLVSIIPQNLILSFLSLYLATAQILQYETTPNGFTSPPKGWNSFALQAVGQLTYDQQHVQEQCDYMSHYLGSSGYQYCSLDSGWSVGGHGDDYGRIIFDSSLFDLYALAEHLHGYGMLLGVYVVPGFFASDSNKMIYGTDPPIELSTISDGNCGVNVRCQFNYSAPGVQDYCNSVVNLFAEW
jgi:alpha-galactosidase